MRTDGSGANARLDSSGRRRRRYARGQAMVEFAFVFPFFVMVVFGFIEFCLVQTSVATFNFAAKDAARLGSLIGPTDPKIDTEMVQLIQSHVSGVVMAKGQMIEIFRSDETGAILTGANGAQEDTYNVSNGYQYDANGNAIATTSNWPPSMRNDTLLGADYLGVRISYKYTFLTSFLSGGMSSLSLSASSVQRIEPQDYQSWHSHAPPLAWHRPALHAAPTPAAPGTGAPGSDTGFLALTPSSTLDQRRTPGGAA